MKDDKTYSHSCKTMLLTLSVIIQLLVAPPFLVKAENGANADVLDPITSNKIGVYDGFEYEYWSQNPDPATMLLTGGGTYHCEWDGHNFLFRTGKKLGSYVL